MLRELPTYYYEGLSPQGEWLRLPRTGEVEAIAHGLMSQLAEDEQCCQEGKMYGVLLAETLTGERRILKAVSGSGEPREGWVPSIPGREQVAFAEAETLTVLADLKQQLIRLQTIPERQEYEIQSQGFAMRLQEMDDRHRHRKAQRDRERLTVDSEILDRQSRQDGMERRDLKRERDAVLRPLRRAIEQADVQIMALRKQRKQRSQLLQAQMHESYRLMNFLGTSATLQQLMPEGMPTGTGDCCAPKLLHYAATHQLKPIAMAEFWWGRATADKQSGEFYGACVERCQPLMGFMLAGLPMDLLVLYEDEGLIVVDKPAGLLSVPGRSGERQDSVLTRLRLQGKTIFSVHRLDQDTSGILLFAKDVSSRYQLVQQFQQRQAQKRYQAVLSEAITAERGMVSLPLWGDPGDRPRQKVDWQRGKASLTHFQRLDSQRVEFVPVTGRTHQIRVHAAVGLGVPILGDRLYGGASAMRLHLCAHELQLIHPGSQRPLHLQITPHWAPPHPPIPTDDPN